MTFNQFDGKCECILGIAGLTGEERLIMHVIFVPFSDISGAPFQWQDEHGIERETYMPGIAQMSMQWLEDRWRHKYGVLCEQVRYDDKPSMEIALCVTRNDVIYVVGHGEVGSPTIHSRLNGGETLNYRLVCERLVDSGFSVGSRAKVKFYSCHSGEGLVDAEPFAKRAAVYMRTQMGRRNAKYYGYQGTITGYRDLAGPTTGFHKASEMGGDVVGRASEWRLIF